MKLLLLCNALIAVLAVLSLSTTTNVFAAEKTLQDPRRYTAGKLTLGTSDPAYAPWMLNNDPVFENPLVYQLAVEGRFKLEEVAWIEQTSENVITVEFKEKPYDLAIQQISLPEPHKHVVLFSQLYFQPERIIFYLSPIPADSRWSTMVEPLV